MLREWVEGTGWQDQYLIDQGIIQNNTLEGGSLSSALLNFKSTKLRAGNIGLNCNTRGKVGRVEVDIRPVEQTLTNGNNQLFVLP